MWNGSYILHLTSCVLLLTSYFLQERGLDVKRLLPAATGAFADAAASASGGPEMPMSGEVARLATTAMRKLTAGKDAGFNK